MIDADVQRTLIKGSLSCTCKTAEIMTPPEMTSASLLVWIVLGMMRQVALWRGIGSWRHWGEYHALRTGAGSDGGIVVPAQETLPSASEPTSLAAWSGFRNCRVDHKEIEDGAQSICSCDLVPEDKQPRPVFKPGQFLTFRLDVSAPDGKTEQITRCYSLSDATRAESYRASIKRVPAPPGGAFPPGRSSNYFHRGRNPCFRSLCRMPQERRQTRYPNARKGA